MTNQLNITNNHVNMHMVQAMVGLDDLQDTLTCVSQVDRIDAQLLSKMESALSKAWEHLIALDTHLKTTDNAQIAPHLHIASQHLNQKYLKLYTQFHAQFPFPGNQQQSLQAPAPISQKNVVSFQVGPADNTQTQTTTVSTTVLLDRISYHLRNNNQAQALREFDLLPADIQTKVYGALWIARGEPMHGNPIAHDNFGEVSFKNWEPRCHSTLAQKASAIESIKMQTTLLEMIELLEQNDIQSVRTLFDALPKHMQNLICGKHWEACGRPTSHSPEEALRRIAHDNFGRVSFLGEELRCDVSADKKIQMLKACLLEYTEKFRSVRILISNKQRDWDIIDRKPAREMAGAVKNETKSNDLHALAKMIVPEFMGNAVRVTPPHFNGTNHKGLAAEYIKAYPCLKPFFFQLINDLQFNDQLIELNSHRNQDAPKPSSVPGFDLNAMSNFDKKTYRTSIMNETLETLREGYYINSRGEKITLNLSPSVASLECVTNSGGFARRPVRYDTRLFLDRKDCLTVTRELTERGFNPIVLDAASDHAFGGGYKTGAGAQEENMTRRSGLCIGADTSQGVQQNHFYPLSSQGDHAGLYISNVPVFRGEEQHGYPYLDQPFETAVAIVAAPNFNPEHQARSPNPIRLENVNGELRIPAPQSGEMKQKLRTVLQMAVNHGHDSIVLIPLGCGAFCNPPKHVSEMMMDLIKKEFPKSFKEIHISIIDDHNTGKAHNPRGNYMEFCETMQKSKIPFKIT